MSKYRMKIDSNVITHLGVNLYSNTPSVLSEIVANAWDADATKVRITISDQEITIEDDGCGMTAEDINDKYLNIGYRRRENDGAVTKKYKRKVMGRKGIGKLSAFSIAKNVSVLSQKNGEKNGFELNIDAIMDHVNQGKELEAFEPWEIGPEKISLSCLNENGTGSMVILRGLKKNVTRTPDALRKNLARRFGILGEKHNFEVEIDGEPVTIADRGYFDKIEFIWQYGGTDVSELCTNAKGKYEREGTISVKNDDGAEEIFQISGWIGTSLTSTALKEEEAHSIVVMVRNKLAQENILDEFAEGGIYATYVLGEINADYLDLDEKEDITTSSRQNIITDDYRYDALKKWAHGELKNIENNWTKLRKSEGHDKAMKNKTVEKWYINLPEEYRGHAKELFGNLNKIGIEDAEDRKTLFQHALMGFENLRYRKTLDDLKDYVDDPSKWSSVFANSDDLEAAFYHKIVAQRLAVIDVLVKHVDDSALEKVIQDHIFKHLWLLDPSWERGSLDERKEESIKKCFVEIDEKLPDDIKEGRFDIRYQNAAGQHVIIELKRANVKGKLYSLSQGSIQDQMDRYKKALRKYLDKVNDHGTIRCICIMGAWPTNWSSDPKDRQENEEALDKMGMKVMLYENLILNAKRMYKEFSDAHKDAGRIVELIQSLDDLEF